MAEKEKEQESNDTYVAKLSIKAIGCDPRLAKGQDRQLLCRIFGKAQALKHGEDRNTGNVWTALQGTFEAINLQGDPALKNDKGEPVWPDYGKTVQSGKLFLPGGIQDAIEGAVQEIENSDHPESASVRFALEIYSVKAANPIGYSYEAKNLIPRTTADELTELRQLVTGGTPMKQLAAGGAAVGSGGATGAGAAHKTEKKK